MSLTEHQTERRGFHGVPVRPLSLVTDQSGPKGSGMVPALRRGLKLLASLFRGQSEVVLREFMHGRKAVDACGGRFGDLLPGDGFPQMERWSRGRFVDRPPHARLPIRA